VTAYASESSVPRAVIGAYAKRRPSRSPLGEAPASASAGTDLRYADFFVDETGAATGATASTAVAGATGAARAS